MLDDPELFASEVLEFHEELSRNMTLHVLTQALHEIVEAETQLARQHMSADQIATAPFGRRRRRPN